MARARSIRRPSASETLRTIAADAKHLGAEIGLTAVLDTWGQMLTHHPHVHCIVPGGGLSPDGARRIGCRPGFFLPVRVLSRLYRRLFPEKLAAAYRAGQLDFFGDLAALADAQPFATFLAPLHRAEWVVFAKRPFAGPEQVLAYSSRYTHRIAISNRRLVALNEDRVTFTSRDYRHGAAVKRMTLSPHEFIRRHPRAGAPDLRGATLPLLRRGDGRHPDPDRTTSPLSQARQLMMARRSCPDPGPWSLDCKGMLLHADTTVIDRDTNNPVVSPISVKNSMLAQASSCSRGALHDRCDASSADQSP